MMVFREQLMTSTGGFISLKLPENALYAPWLPQGPG